MTKSNYFSHDSNARNDDKIIAMRMQMGAEGYAIYFMLLERLRESDDHTSVKDYNMLAFDFRVDALNVKKVVEGFGLFQFTDDGKRFYSESFTKRMQMMESKRVKQSEAGKLAMQRRWSGSSGNITNLSKSDNSLITNLCESDNKEKKRKENKVNNSVSTNADTLSDFNKSDDAVQSTLFGDEVKPVPKEEQIDYDEIVRFWNESTKGIYGRLTCIEHTRRKMTYARIKEYGREAFMQAMRYAAQSEYLKSVAWFSFDWMIKPNNFPKVLENKYGLAQDRTQGDTIPRTDNNQIGGEAGRNVTGTNITPVYRKRVYD